MGRRGIDAFAEQGLETPCSADLRCTLLEYSIPLGSGFFPIRNLELGPCI